MIQCRKQGNVGVLVGMSTGGVGNVTFQVIGTVLCREGTSIITNKSHTKY